MDLIQIWYGDRYYCTQHLDTSLIDFDLESRSQKCEEANACVTRGVMVSMSAYLAYHQC